LILHKRHPSHVVSTLIAFGSAYSKAPRQMRAVVDNIAVDIWEIGVKKVSRFDGIQGRKVGLETSAQNIQHTPDDVEPHKKRSGFVVVCNIERDTLVGLQKTGC
jgi:hypothetical protein